MKPTFTPRKTSGLTLIEVIALVFVLALLAVVLLPSFGPTHVHSKRIHCMSNLKQLGMAYHIWAGDNNEKYPFEVSVTNGGTMEFLTTSDAWKTFQVMSNELNMPKLIYCPEDSLRSRYATNWGYDLKNKISYFIGLDGSTNSPQALLSGDDNFLLNHTPVKSGLMNVTSAMPIEWDATRHGRVTRQMLFIQTKIGTGNVLLNDGSVQGVPHSGLTNQINQTTLATNRLIIP